MKRQLTIALVVLLSAVPATLFSAWRQASEEAALAARGTVQAVARRVAAAERASALKAVADARAALMDAEAAAARVGARQTTGLGATAAARANVACQAEQAVAQAERRALMQEAKAEQTAARTAPRPGEQTTEYLSPKTREFLKSAAVGFGLGSAGALAGAAAVKSNE